MSRLSDKLMIPKDICAGDVKIAITGNRELYIENYRGILEYTDQCMVLQTKNGFLKIAGKKLQIAFYTNEDMKITGFLNCIEFDKEQTS